MLEVSAMCKLPAGSVFKWSMTARVSASVACSRRQLLSSARPSLVGERVRVLRLSSLMPCSDSRRLMCWLTADGVMDKAAAAAFMLPCSKTAANTSKGLMSCIPDSLDSEVGLNNTNSKIGIISVFRRPYNTFILIVSETRSEQ